MPNLSEVVAEVKPEEELKHLMILQFILHFALGYSANSMVSMINALQISAHLPLNNIPYIYPCRETFELLI